MAPVSIFNGCASSHIIARISINAVKISGRHYLLFGSSPHSPQRPHVQSTRLHHQHVPGTAIACVAIGTLGIGTAAVLFQYLKMKSLATKKKDEEERTPAEPPEIKVEPEVTNICVNTTDLEEITQLLGTRYHVL